MNWKDGKSCDHPGCLSHVSHPCEVCGRIGGRPIDVTTAFVLRDKHALAWRNMPESYWFLRLVGEIGELGNSLANNHEHPPDWELAQIAAICMNWLDMRKPASR